MKKYTQAPLPFQGQKRMFGAQFIKILPNFNDKTVFVDLFGGSGLLSHIAQRERPDATVVYNDFDNYSKRIANIPRTNALLDDLRVILANTPRKERITGEIRDAIIARIEEAEIMGYVDYITLSASILFSAKIVKSFDELCKQTLYNRIRMTDYSADGYFDGIEVVSMDYKALFDRYKDMDNVVFLVDPPYLNTDTSSYSMSWKLGDYLDVLTVLIDSSYIYFTSNKSDIVELCQWIGQNKVTADPFAQATRCEARNSVNYSAKYTDIMLFKNTAA